MSFDGLFLNKVVLELQKLNSGKITKIYQLAKFDFLFTIRSFNSNYNMYFNMTPDSSRIQLTNLDYERPKNPSSFTMFLRKHLEGAIIRSIKQHRSDRICTFELAKTNELGFLENKFLIFEIMGRYSNLVILDHDYKVIDAYKHINPFDNANRTVFPGCKYDFPPSSKDNAFESNDNLIYTNPSELVQKYEGISMVSANEIIKRKISLHDFINLDVDPVSTVTTKSQNYYYVDLTYKDGPKTRYSDIFDMLDIFYHAKDQAVRNSQKSDDLLKFITSKISRNDRKISKFTEDLLKANNAEEYKIIGDLIYANMHLIKKGDKSVTLLNYYTNKEQTITIDKRLSAQKNGEKYYKKFSKLKKSISHISEQIEIAKEENEYLNIVKEQIQNATLEDLEEIRTELENSKMIKKSNKQNKRKKVMYKIYKSDDGTSIFVGKNNIQNEYLTHKNALPNEVWVHIKDSPSSHVIIKQSLEDVSEETLRLAANICAYYSKYKYSSSVAVDYTKARFVKKIPGKRNCFVTYKNHKTIYIDPDEQVVLNLKNHNKWCCDFLILSVYGCYKIYPTIRSPSGYFILFSSNLLFLTINSNASTPTLPINITSTKTNFER